MPTPHGSRGGIAFSADEVRVLRRALTEVLSPLRGRPAAELPVPPAERLVQVVAPRPAEHLRDCRRLATALDAAVHEAGRLRAFLLEESRPTALPRHRGSFVDFVDNDVRQRQEALMPAPRRLPTLPVCPEPPEAPGVPACCGPALADEGERKPRPGPKPAPKPAAPKPQQKPVPQAPQPEPEAEPGAPEPGEEPEKPPEQPARRRTPTPAEIWPPRRRDHKPDQSTAWARSARPAQGWLP